MAKAKKKADKFRCGYCDNMTATACGTSVLIDVSVRVEMCWRCAGIYKANRRSAVAVKLLEEILADHDLELDPKLVERILYHLEEES